MKERGEAGTRTRASGFQGKRFNVSRRGVLKGGLFGAAALGLGTKVSAAPAPHVTFNPGLFLLDRATYGLNADMLNEIRHRGYTGFLEWQLAPDQIDDSAADATLDSFVFHLPLWYTGPAAQNPNRFSSIFGKTPAEIFFTFPGPTPGTTAQGLSYLAPVLRAYYSRRQLFWVMCEFWRNVHNRFLLQLYQHALWWPFDENVVQAHALGKYKNLVRASAMHSSMMLYLDQYRSCKENPNENFARELMELHTIGTTFQESDVVAAAKVLTGWSMHFFEAIIAGYPLPDHYDCPNLDLDFWGLGEFVYLKDKHAFGTKTVLGQTFGGNVMCFPEPCAPCHGLEEGEQLIDYICTRDETGEHIARRLIGWFLMDDPPQDLVDRVANAYLVSDTDIKETLRELFRLDNLDQIHPGPFQKVRRPVNLLVGSMRGLDVELNPLCDADGDGQSSEEECSQAGAVVTGTSSGQWPVVLANAGQGTGLRASPDGYPEENDAWTAAIYPRLEFCSDLVHDGDPGLSVPTSKIDQIFGTTPVTGLAAQAAEVLYLGKVRPQEITAIQAYIDGLATGPNPPDTETLRRECVSMILSTPTYQYLH